jgi:hypothetical protein
MIDPDIHPLLDPQRVVAWLAEPWRRRDASGNTGLAC